MQAEALAASQEFADYMRELIRLRRGDLGDDLLSDLLRAQEGDDGLTDDEVLASAILLLNAGHEASVNVFGNGLVALLEHPDQWQRLVDGDIDPALAVEEMLRFDSALQLFERTATADVEVAESSCPRERRSRCCWAPPTATRPCSTRQMRSTSVAIRTRTWRSASVLHFCLGAPLARVELAESLRLWSRRTRPLWLGGRHDAGPPLCCADTSPSP